MTLIILRFKRIGENDLIQERINKILINMLQGDGNFYLKFPHLEEIPDSKIFQKSFGKSGRF